MSNTFNNDNPWQSQSNNNNGPRYGNAYESEPIPSSAFTTGGGGAYDNSQQQPAYNDFSSTGYRNAWSGGESNKTEQPQSPDTSQDAYQFTGTRYGNQTASGGNAYSAASLQPATGADSYQLKTKNSSTVVPADHDSTYSSQPLDGSENAYHTPNKWRFWFRFGILLASIGHLGFAAGARPYSGEQIPFSTPACFYYLFAVAILSIIWSLYHSFFYCYRRATKKPKTNRVVLIAIDLLMAVLWGIGVIIEAVKFKCPPGGKFCNFYNVSLFWGYLTFVAYIFAVVWDLYGACSHKRRARK